METNKLNTYLDDIGRRGLLTPAEEQQLSARIQSGDERALNRLVERNLRFVVKLASQYQGKGLSMDDLVSEGNIGLMKAANRYDAQRGLRFAGFAAPYIRQHIEKALRKEGAEQRIEATRNGSSRSVDAPLGSKVGVSLLSVLADEHSPLADERTYSRAVEEAVEYALKTLNERETDVVNACFGIGCDRLTMAEIAAEMHIRRERVRQIRNTALRRMRKAYKRRLAELRQQ